jgi:para-nitrobenzyl esterase
MKSLSFASLLVCTMLSPATLLADAAGSPFRQPRFEVKQTADIVYGTGPVKAPQPGPKKLLLDLYEPAGADTPRLRPAFVVIHGGGFKGGSRSAANMANLCKEFAARGYVCISIDYRMQGDDPVAEGGSVMERSIRAAVTDAAVAVQWLVTNADKYKVDTKRIAVGGGSAGAITSLILTYGKQREGAGKLPIAAVVNLWGSLYKSANDIEAGDPPVIIIHGTNDQTVKFTGAEDIVKRTKEVGVVCELCAIQGAGHGVNLANEFEGVALTQRIANFLDTHLKLAELTP